MRIFRAIGFVIFIVAVQMLMSPIYKAFESASVKFFGTTEIILNVVDNTAATGFSFPRVPSTTPHD